MYNEIKQSIINNFLNKGYLYSCGYKKESIIGKIIENSIFETEYDYNTDIMTMKLGDNINLNFNFEWGESSYSCMNANKTNKTYYKVVNIK